MGVEYVTKDELKATIASILEKYPWFADYPVTCHAKCARWDIAEEHGHEAGKAWGQYDSVLWLLTGKNAGKPTR